MTRLLDHLPAFYKDIREFRELSATVSESLEGKVEDLRQVENDQFILTSGESAIYRREKEFAILPDRKLETLDFRKKRLLSRMQSNPPYVYEYLKVLFDSLLGKDTYELELDTFLLELSALVHAESATFYQEAVNILERFVPLNIKLTTGILFIQEISLMRSISQGKSDTFLYSGEFYSGTDFDPNTQGVSYPALITVVEKPVAGLYVFPESPSYSGEITDSSEGFMADQSLNIIQIASSGEGEFGYLEGNGVIEDTDVEVNELGTASVASYSFSGERYSGEE